jgi:hypothetical protein
MSRLDSLDRLIRGAVATVPAELRPDLICILELPDEMRSATIEELDREDLMPNLAELLIDLEEGPAMRGAVLAELRRQEGDRNVSVPAPFPRVRIKEASS